MPSLVTALVRTVRVICLAGQLTSRRKDHGQVSALLHKSLRHVRLSPMGQGASMRNDAESIHVPVPSTQLVRLQSGADRQGASDLLVR